MANPVVSWAKENPLLAGGAALAVVVVVMLATGGSSAPQEEASGGMGTAGVAAYYSAMAQQNQAGAAVQIAQIQANAVTNKALIAATYGIESEKIKAPIETLRVQSDYNLGIVQLNAYNNVRMAEISSNERINANNVNLKNAALSVEQNIAFKKINAARPSVLSQILGAATQVGTAYATGGVGV